MVDAKLAIEAVLIMIVAATYWMWQMFLHKLPHSITTIYVRL